MIVKLRIWILIMILVGFGNLTFGAIPYSKIDRKKFYEVLNNGNESNIGNFLKLVQQQKTSSQKNAFEGVLLMKTADFEKGAVHKVKIFKKGVLLLENEIEVNPNNLEYRFLRLTVQEHAHSILKYNKEIKEDKNLIIAHFSKLDTLLKSVIENYAETSKVLKKSEL